MPIIRFHDKAPSMEQSVIDGDTLDGVGRIERELEFYGRIVDFGDIEKRAIKVEYQEQCEVKRKGGSLRVRMTKQDDQDPVYSLTLKYRDQNEPTKKNEIPQEISEDMFTAFKTMADNMMIKRRFYIPMDVALEEEAAETPTEEESPDVETPDADSTEEISSGGEESSDEDLNAAETPEADSSDETVSTDDSVEETPQDEPESVVSEGDRLYWEVDVFYDLEGNRKDWCKIDLTIPHALESVPDLPIKLEEVITNQYGERTPEEIEKLTKIFQEEFLITL